jgi:hypothetical protein
VTKQEWQQESALVLKHEPVPGNTLLEVDNSVVGISHGPLVDPGVDLLVGSELQHLPDLGGRTDEGATDLDLLQDEGKRHKLRNGVFRSADLNELAANVEEAEVLGQGETGAGDGADDQVERVGVLGLVALLLGGNLEKLLVRVIFGTILGRGEAYEAVCAHLESVLLLGVGAADGNNVGSHGFGPKETEVAETTDADDTDTLAGTTAVLLQGRVESDTATQHRCRLGRVNAVGDDEDEIVVSSPVACISAVGLLASGPLAVVRSNHLSNYVRNRRSGLVEAFHHTFGQ